MVRNGTPTGIHVPVGYDGGYVRLQAGQLSLRKTRVGKDDMRLAWVEPGQEQVVFELPLDDLMRVRPGASPPGPGIGPGTPSRHSPPSTNTGSRGSWTRRPSP